MFFHNLQYPLLVISAIKTCDIRKNTSFSRFLVFTVNFFVCSTFQYYKCRR